MSCWIPHSNTLLFTVIIEESAFFVAMPQYQPFNSMSAERIRVWIIYVLSFFESSPIHKCKSQQAVGISNKIHSLKTILHTRILLGKINCLYSKWVLSSSQVVYVLTYDCWWLRDHPLTTEGMHNSARTTAWWRISWPFLFRFISELPLILPPLRMMAHSTFIRLSRGLGVFCYCRLAFPFIHSSGIK